MSLSYAIVTPAKNEEENVRRLGACLVAQTRRPAAWLLVDNGSTDGTPQVIAQLAGEHDWVGGLAVPGKQAAVRSGAVVRAFHAGLAALSEDYDVVVKLDADVSFAPDFFDRLLAEFERDPSLGIAGGLCYEQEDDVWRAQHVTRSHVRGATRAYRLACLEAVLPLEERIGWDGIDELKAAARGWETRSFNELPFRHHRALGVRDGMRRAWIAQGDMAHFMGYRFSYLLTRTAYRALREPVALAMLQGYFSALLRRAPRCSDMDVRRRLRGQQSVRNLPLRIREALGRA